MAWIAPRKLKSGREQLYVYAWYRKPGELRAKKRRFSVRNNSMASAKRIKAKVETMIAEGSFYGFLEEKDATSWSLGDLRDPYLDHMKQLRPKSEVWRRTCFDHVARILGKGSSLEGLDEADRDRFVRERLREKASHSTVNQEVAVFNHAMKLAYRWRKQSGVTGFRFGDWTKLDPKETARAAHRFSIEQIEKVHAIAETLADDLELRQGAIAVAISLATGARLGQVRIMRWSKVDEKTGVWDRGRYKKGEPTLIRLPAHLLDQMMQLRQKGQDWVFASVRRPGSPRHDFRSYWKLLQDKLGLEGVQWRDMRHAAGTEKTKREGIRKSQRLLGHQDVRTTEGYAHDAEIIDAVDWQPSKKPAPKRGPRAGTQQPVQRRAKRSKTKTRNASPRSG